MKAFNSLNQSDDKNLDLDAQQLKRVTAAIDGAIKKGLYEVIVYESLRNNVQDQLRADGYETLRRGGRMGENNHLIKWIGAKE